MGAAAEQELAGAEDVFQALKRLDELLERAIVTGRRVHGVEPGADPHRGLYVMRDEARRLVLCAPGEPLLRVGGPSRRRSFDQLGAAFRLTALDCDTLLLALAPEVDLRYERIYAFLHDDVTRRRPSVDLALDLLCRSREEKLAHHSRFAPDAPLLARRLLRLAGETGYAELPFLAHALVPDPQVVRMILGVTGADKRLAAVAELVEPERNRPASDRERALARLERDARSERHPLVISLEGPQDRGSGGRRSMSPARSASGCSSSTSKRRRGRSARTSPRSRCGMPAFAGPFRTCAAQGNRAQASAPSPRRSRRRATSSSSRAMRGRPGFHPPRSRSRSARFPTPSASRAGGRECAPPAPAHARRSSRRSRHASRLGPARSTTPSRSRRRGRAGGRPATSSPERGARLRDSADSP